MLLCGLSPLAQRAADGVPGGSFSPAARPRQAIGKREPAPVPGRKGVAITALNAPPVQGGTWPASPPLCQESSSAIRDYFSEHRLKSKRERVFISNCRNRQPGNRVSLTGCNLRPPCVIISKERACCAAVGFGTGSGKTGVARFSHTKSAGLSRFRAIK
jgi:hypothetical protein